MVNPHPLNIFLIVIDALRPDHLGCCGYHRDTSPVIDQIALEGILFENTIAQSSWTKPSVASLLSGTYPQVHGVQQVAHALGSLGSFLPEVLRHAGYVTGAIQTNPFLSKECGFGQGFDHYLELFEKKPGIFKPTAPEALTAVSVAALTIYDMAKAVDRHMQIEAIRLSEKRGGQSGDVVVE